MKIGLFNNVTGGAGRFTPYIEQHPEELELIPFDCPPTYENLDKIKEHGCEALLYFNTKKEGEEYFSKMADMGIKYLSTSSAGYDHFNLPAMRKYGIRGSNVPFYSPNAIAEHAVLLTMSLLRNLREQLARIDDNNYKIEGVMGREMRNMVFGIVGTGRIGATTIQCLSGFGPKKILACDPYEKEELKDVVTYTTKDALFAESDVIIFHCVYSEENHHMVNDASISAMKKGVVLVNVARGPLFDLDALVRGVESGQIGGLAMDVIEQEGLLRGGIHPDVCPIPQLGRLLIHSNVIFTNHTAFYTDEAYRNLSETAVENLLSYVRTGNCERELVRNL